MIDARNQAIIGWTCQFQKTSLLPHREYFELLTNLFYIPLDQSSVVQLYIEKYVCHIASRLLGILFWLKWINKEDNHFFCYMMHYFVLELQSASYIKNHLCINLFTFHSDFCIKKFSVNLFRQKQIVLHNFIETGCDK